MPPLYCVSKGSAAAATNTFLQDGHCCRGGLPQGEGDPLAARAGFLAAEGTVKVCEAKFRWCM